MFGGGPSPENAEQLCGVLVSTFDQVPFDVVATDEARRHTEVFAAGRHGDHVVALGMYLGASVGPFLTIAKDQGNDVWERISGVYVPLHQTQGVHAFSLEGNRYNGSAREVAAIQHLGNIAHSTVFDVETTQAYARHRLEEYGDQLRVARAYPVPIPALPRRARKLL